MIYTSKTSGNYEAARVLFKQALERDPRAVNAMAGIGWSSTVSVLNGWSAAPAEDIARAEAAVIQLLAILKPRAMLFAPSWPSIRILRRAMPSWA